MEIVKQHIGKNGLVYNEYEPSEEYKKQFDLGYKAALERSDGWHMVFFDGENSGAFREGSLSGRSEVRRRNGDNRSHL